MQWYENDWEEADGWRAATYWTCTPSAGWVTQRSPASGFPLSHRSGEPWCLACHRSSVYLQTETHTVTTHSADPDILSSVSKHTCGNHSILQFTQREDTIFCHISTIKKILSRHIWEGKRQWASFSNAVKKNLRRNFFWIGFRKTFGIHESFLIWDLFWTSEDFPNSK